MLKLLLGLVVVGALCLAAPATGLAQSPADSSPDGSTALPAFEGNVQAEDGETYNTEVRVKKVAERNGKLVATRYRYDVEGEESGLVTPATGPALSLVQQQQGVCPILHLEIGPIFLDLLGLQVETNRIVIDIRAVEGPGNLLGNLLCALVGILDPNSGAVATRARFDGTVDGEGGETYNTEVQVRKVAERNGRLVATRYRYDVAGEGSGLVTPATGPALPLVQQQGTCEILTLDIAPIFLDLLGLQVETSRILIEIRGVTGPGRLLGNLLCGLFGILDPDGGAVSLRRLAAG